MNDKIVIQCIRSISNINTKNHNVHAPFAVLGDLVYVDKKWWMEIHPKLRLKIISSFGNIFGYVVREKIPENTIKEGEVFEHFLNAFHSIFSFNNWCDCLDEYTICIIDKKGIEKLKNMKKIYIEDIKKHYNPLLIFLMNKFIENNKESGVFIRLDKGNVKKTPKFTLEQIISEIVINSGSSMLFLSPWKYEITKSNEYRVFVYNNYVSAISQKECYKYVGLTFEKMGIIAKNILGYISKIKEKIPYNTYCMDLWVTINSVYLIEILPGESWTNSESCLFNWEIDHEKLTQTQKTYVKYIDVQSPIIRASSFGSVDSFILN